MEMQKHRVLCIDLHFWFPLSSEEHSTANWKEASDNPFINYILLTVMTTESLLVLDPYIMINDHIK